MDPKLIREKPRVFCHVDYSLFDSFEPIGNGSRDMISESKMFFRSIRSLSLFEAKFHGSLYQKLSTNQ